MNAATFVLSTGRPRVVQWYPSWIGVARNASCPCGSGKKFKHCHGTVV
jgi:uncharacterized protein YecA (UPF0149 family)